MSVENPDALDLEYLDISDCTTHGIYLEDCTSSVEVDNCTITDPGLIGIEARDCRGVTLEGHSITDATDYGIKCYDVLDMTVSGNSILGDASSQDFVGIRVKPYTETSPYMISGNSIERCASRGIWCAQGVRDSASISQNCVTDTTYDRGSTGVYFYYSSAKMRETTVQSKTHGVVAVCGETYPSSPFRKPDLGDVTGYSEDGNNRFLDNSLFYVWTLGLSGERLPAENDYFVAAGVDSPPNSSKFYGRVIDADPCLGSDPGQYPRLAPGGAVNPEGLRTTLSQNWPNPFNPMTTIRFNVPRGGVVALRIYDAAGRHVRTLVNGSREAGAHEEIWDGRDHDGRKLPSGVYFARLDIEAATEVRKLVLLK